MSCLYRGARCLNFALALVVVVVAIILTVALLLLFSHLLPYAISPVNLLQSALAHRLHGQREAGPALWPCGKDGAGAQASRTETGGPAWGMAVFLGGIIRLGLGLAGWPLIPFYFCRLFSSWF